MKRFRHSLPALTAAFVVRAVLCLVVVVGCNAEGDAQRVLEGTEQSPATTSGVWLERARRAHEAADEARNDAQREQAVAELRGAYEALPVGEPGSDWVRLDLGARLAALELDRGNAEAALKWVQRVLPLQPQVSVPAANLLVVAGRAHEALGHEKQAVENYHRALIMNQTLMERSLEGQ